MMSLTTIRQMAQDAAENACRARLKPYGPWDEDIAAWRSSAASGTLPRLPFPFLGDYVPENYELEEEVFVDSSGWGSPGEPAMTIPEFLDTLRSDRSYAITEAGQFQVYIGVYRRTDLN